MKKRMKQAVLSLSEAMEKEFKDLPNKLAIQSQKDISKLKIQEAKLAAAIKKTEKQRKVTQHKLHAMTVKNNKKPTKAGKKHLKTLTTVSREINQMLTSLGKQLSQVQKQSSTLSFKQEKFNALSKEILKLEKQWEKNYKTPSVEKLKIRKKTKKSPAQTSTELPASQPLDSEVMSVSAIEITDAGMPMEESQE